MGGNVQTCMCEHVHVCIYTCVRMCKRICTDIVQGEAGHARRCVCVQRRCTRGIESQASVCECATGSPACAPGSCARVRAGGGERCTRMRGAEGSTAYTTRVAGPRTRTASSPTRVRGGGCVRGRPYTCGRPAPSGAAGGSGGRVGAAPWARRVPPVALSPSLSPPRPRRLRGPAGRLHAAGAGGGEPGSPRGGGQGCRGGGRGLREDVAAGGLCQRGLPQGTVLPVTCELSHGGTRSRWGGSRERRHGGTGRAQWRQQGHWQQVMGPGRTGAGGGQAWG